MISNKTYIVLYLVWLIVILFGISMPLMENDSAQHASMAMQMVLKDNFLDIFKGNLPYLDKPHLHFWLAALSFKLFGFETWAYRLPSILLILVGAYGCYGLSKTLFQNKHIAKLSALVFLSSITIFISLIDVRTDAVLTAFVILAAWKWTDFLQKDSLWAAIFGGIFTALAYSTKGLFAIAIIGLYLLILVIYHQYWKKLLSTKLLWGLLAFAVFCIPMFYAYYHQFGMEGIKFITFGQSSGRFSGDDFGAASKNDYSFYFHTILWAFLPWSLWLIYSFANSIKFIRNKTKSNIVVLSATLFSFMLIMNFSQFKLPHYLNPLIGFTAILVSAVAVHSFENYRKNQGKTLQVMQYILICFSILGLGFLALVCFPFDSIPVILIALALVIFMVMLFLSSESRIERTVSLTVGFTFIFYFYLASTFYPDLLYYQSGIEISKIAQKNKIMPNNLYVLGTKDMRSLDWYLKSPSQNATAEELKAKRQPVWVIMIDQNPATVLGKNFEIVKSYRLDHYRISRLKWEFLNPESRPEVIQNAWLVHYIPKNN